MRDIKVGILLIIIGIAALFLASDAVAFVMFFAMPVTAIGALLILMSPRIPSDSLPPEPKPKRPVGLKD